MPATELGFGLTLHGDFMDDSAFVEQLLQEAQPYDFEPSLWNCYNASQMTPWSLPFDGMTYSNFYEQNDMSASASSVDYQSSIPSLNTLNSGTEDSHPTMSTEESPMSQHPGSPEMKNLSSVTMLSPEPTTLGSSSKDTFRVEPLATQFSASPVNTQSLEQPPRMSNRRLKYKSRKATSNTSSDDDSVRVLSRPAHNKAERNYRQRLNSSFGKLLEVINIVAADSISLHDKEIGKNLSKSDILHLASLRLITIERENQRLREQLEQIRGVPQRATEWSRTEPAGY